MKTRFKFLHHMNAFSLICEIDVGISTDSNESHRQKAFLPIDVTKVGMSIDVNDLQ